MAKRGGGDGWIWGVVLFAGAAALYAYTKTGRGTENSPLLPDAVEGPIDRVVESLNRAFGDRWVTLGLNAVQSYIERTMPAAVWLVNAVYRAEQGYGPKAGAAKKQAAKRLARGGALYA